MTPDLQWAIARLQHCYSQGIKRPEQIVNVGLKPQHMTALLDALWLIHPYRIRP